MKIRRRPLIISITATVVAVAAALLTAPTSYADVAGPYFATPNLGSDPHMISCSDGATAGYCLYTSRDMGQSFAYPGNFYPMEETRAYFSTNGYSNWIDKGRVFHENTLESAGWVPTDAHHLWAPGAVKSGSFYYLFVPDVSDTSADAPPNSSTSSRISVSRSSSPFGPFTYQGTVDNMGYMSDPDVLVNGINRVLLWADGDNSTCGGFQSALLGTNMMTVGFHSRQFINIAGINVLGDCDGSGPKGGPYVEGGELTFSGGLYRMYFAAKPTFTPPECSTDWYGPGTDNEVIAWATAPNAQGPYTYQGIVMCGSSTEWTNQATTLELSSNARDIIVYHDSDTNKERRLHAECLFTNDVATIVGGVYRQPIDAPNGFNDCMAGVNASYWGFHMRDPQNPTLPPIIRAPADGGALAANRYAVGPWERYKRVSLGSNKYGFQALSNGLYLCTPDPGTPISASCSNTSSTTAQWTIEAVSGGGARYKSVAHNKYLSVAGNGLLYASGEAAGDAAVVNSLLPGGKSF